MRALAAHRDAVLDALDEALAVLNVGGRPAFADFIAGVVLSAEDGYKTRYVVITKEVTGEVLSYGPYATHDAAQKAIESGAVGLMEGARAAVWPLIPGPKAKRPATVKQRQPKEKTA